MPKFFYFQLKNRPIFNLVHLFSVKIMLTFKEKASYGIGRLGSSITIDMADLFTGFVSTLSSIFIFESEKIEVVFLLTSN